MESEKLDIVINEKNVRFNYRAAGILVNNNQILLQNTNDTDGYHGYKLIGGKVKFNESAQSAVKREFIEELGMKIKIGKLFKVIDHSVRTGKKQWQQIMLVFIVNAEGKELINQQGYKWIDKDQLNEIEIRPNIFTKADQKLYIQDVD
jgi:ADP-ribose pyrophosphatase YjhB (NUDIX family)